MDQEASLNPNGQMVAEAFQTYLQDLQPEQLAYLGLDETDRDVFCKTHLRVEYGSDSYDPFGSDQNNALFNMPELREGDDVDQYTKSVLHEIKHRFDDQREKPLQNDPRNGWKHRAKNATYQVFGKAAPPMFLGTTIGIPVVGAVVLGITSLIKAATGNADVDFAENMTAIGATGLALGGSVYALGVAFSPALRRAETACDEFADRVIPSAPFDLHDRSQLEAALDTAFPHIISHPRTPVRNEQSRARCEEFLSQSAEIGLPDFRTYLNYQPEPAENTVASAAPTKMRR